ncbi:MAG: M56 family metallopeptidase, partial [Flavobacteriaceae bacterium]|nr:M56 family metallopeptidase [Flavobacteriaceae bacterium]
MEALVYVCKSAAILSLFYLVYYLVLRKNTLFTANRHFLIGGILAAALLPALKFTKVVYKEIPTYTSVMIPNNVSNQLVATSEATSALDIWSVLFFVYSIGVIVMLVRLTIQIWSLIRLIRNHPSEKRGSFYYVKINETLSPFSFFNYIVYNPSSHSEDDLEMILKHEKVHVREWHSFDILLANLNRCLQWINPFAWFYKFSIEENLEYLADSQTVQQLTSKKEYQLALVKASSPFTSPALTNPFYQSFIKKRIIMLNKSNSHKRNLWKMGIILPILAFFLYSFNVSEIVQYQETEPEVETKAQSVEVSPILKTDISAESADTILNEAFEPITKTIVSEENTSPVTATTIETDAQDEVVETMVLQNELAEQSSFQEVKILITKNTTNAELDEIKKRLKKDHGLDMSYTVSRNSNKEITSISISYTGENRNSNYSVSDDDGIEDFYFYEKENGDSGFWSETHELRREERMKEREIREEERAYRNAERLARTKEREVEREERMKDIDRRRKNQQRRIEKQQERIKERNKQIAERSYNLAKLNSTRSIAKSKGSNNVNVFVDSDDGYENAIIIDKDTSDETLA